LMSLTRTVPAAVPLLFHSSCPCVPSLAEKNSVPFTLIRLLGVDEPLPELMSLTRAVPSAVPSLFHISMPLTPSSAAKYVVEPIASIDDGLEDWVFVLMSRTICGVKDGVRRSSSASMPRGRRRRRARTTRLICLPPRGELNRRRQNEVFIG